MNGRARLASVLRKGVQRTLGAFSPQPEERHEDHRDQGGRTAAQGQSRPRGVGAPFPIERPDQRAAAAQAIPAPTAQPIGEGLVAATPKEYAGLIQQAAEQHDVPERLFSALLQCESDFNPQAKSRAGALGIAQFMPATAKGLGIDPLDPAQAIPAAAQYLRGNFDRFGSWELALAAYNAGMGTVRKYGGIPPYPETRNFVRKVLNAAR